YGSDTLHAQPVVRDIPERDEFKDGGRGYYRNISLVNLWATAPFLHNNAIGPELCGKPANAENDFARARYVGADGKPLAQQPPCVPFDPSVEGRFQLYKRSMYELLHPKERGLKTTLTDADIIIDLGLRSWDGSQEKIRVGFGPVTIPKGIHAGFLNGLQHKQFVGDLFLAVDNPSRLEAEGKKDRVPELKEIAKRLAAEPSKFVDVIREKKPFLEKYYQTCMAEIENDGHRFGEDLPEADKKALTAFLATL
ncbi:MAG: cytochrome c, partial [Usitatibacter sp.]